MIFFPRAASFEDLSARYGPCYRWLVLIVVGAGIVAGVLCTTSFGVAVPAMIRSFGLGQDQVQWAMTGFMLAMTLAMLPTSWLLDRFGFRCVFLTAVTMLAVASVGGYLSPDFTWVVCARILQGAATGIMQPLGVIAVMRLFPPQIQGRASGFLPLPSRPPLAVSCWTGSAGRPSSWGRCRFACLPCSRAWSCCRAQRIALRKASTGREAPC